MAAALLFSHHSSNPLEVGSSDARNNAYNQTYRASLAQNDVLSSDDPIEGFTVPDDLQQYHHHLSRIVPDHPAAEALRKVATPVKAVIDLDEDMSDDELATPMQKQTHKQIPQGKQAVIDEESHEEGHSDKDDANEYAEDEVEVGEDDNMSVDSFETDEETTINDRTPEERKEIEQEIQELMVNVPRLRQDYKVVDRLGTGTFSSVYKAVDLHYHTKWDNTPWHGHHPPSSSAHYQSLPRPMGSKVFVAIKRIYVTSSPERIRNEVSIMLDCLGCRHVSQLITATRHFDQVVLVMPYQRNDDFRDFYRSLSMPAIKSYMRCLLAALRDIHDRKIIHRDVKPANFLFDSRTGIGTLCDFGLASRITSNTSAHGQCLHSGWSTQYPHGQNKHISESDKESIRKLQKDARNKSAGPADKVGYPEKDTRPISKANRAGTRGFRAPEVLLKCSEQTGAIDVWAAGMILLFFLSGKFPLFQSNDDVEALMEIAAIIGRRQMERTATLHSRLFVSNVPVVLGDGMPWREFVTKQNPDIYTPREPDLGCYPFNSPAYRAHLQESVEKAQTHPPPPPPSSSPISPDTTMTTQFPSDAPTLINAPQKQSLSPLPHAHTYPLISPEQHASDVDCAFDLLDQLLHPESTKRITPKRALAHPFLSGAVNPAGDDDDDEDVAFLPDDDEFVPHEFGRGVCGKLHFVEEKTGDMCVKVKVRRCECVDEVGCGGECEGVEREEVRKLKPGEGIAIGRQPCEFHEDMELEF